MHTHFHWLRRRSTDKKRTKQQQQIRRRGDAEAWNADNDAQQQKLSGKNNERILISANGFYWMALVTRKYRAVSRTCGRVW